MYLALLKFQKGYWPEAMKKVSTANFSIVMININISSNINKKKFNCSNKLDSSAQIKLTGFLCLIIPIADVALWINTVLFLDEYWGLGENKLQQSSKYSIQMYSKVETLPMLICP